MALPQEVLAEGLPQEVLAEALPQEVLAEALPQEVLAVALPQEEVLAVALPQEVLAVALPQEEVLAVALPQEEVLAVALPQEEVLAVALPQEEVLAVVQRTPRESPRTWTRWRPALEEAVRVASPWMPAHRTAAAAGATGNLLARSRALAGASRLLAGAPRRVFRPRFHPARPESSPRAPRCRVLGFGRSDIFEALRPSVPFGDRSHRETCSQGCCREPAQEPSRTPRRPERSFPTRAERVRARRERKGIVGASSAPPHRSRPRCREALPCGTPRRAGRTSESSGPRRVVFRVLRYGSLN